MRRRKKHTPAYWVDWCPAVEALFADVRVLTVGLDAPRRVRVYRGDRHITVLARFTSADGVAATAKIKAPL